MENTMEPIMVPYVAIYSAPMVSLDTKVEVRTPESDFCLTLIQGPLFFSYSVPVKSFGSGSAAMTIGERQFSLPGGSYVIISTEADIRTSSERERVALLVAEAAGLITLRYPHLLHEKLFEGVTNAQGHSVIWREGPITLLASPATPAAEVVRDFTADFSSFARLPAGMQHRFQLASRWYRRGHESINQVDKFLFWWTVLEIYPRKKGTAVAATIKQTLQDEAFPNMSMQRIGQNLRISSIYRERIRIVHEGKAFVDVEDKNFRECLDRLGAIATVCLRLLGSLPPGDELQQFMPAD